MKRITFVVSAVILVVAVILSACQSAQPVQVPQPVHVVVDNAAEFTGIGGEGEGEQGLVGAPTNIRSLVAGEALVKGNLEVDGTATLDTMVVTLTETQRLSIAAPTAEPTATPGLHIDVDGVNAPLMISKASTPVASVSGAGGATFETLVVNGASTLTGAVNAATAILTGRQVVTIPTAQPTATPGVFVNSAGAVGALQVWALNATPVAAIDRSGNLSASGTGTFTGAIYGPVPVLAKIANYSVTAADSGAIIKSSGNITLTLPGAAVGLNYCIVNYDGGDLKIEFTDSADVAINEVNSPGDSVTNTTAFDNICLAAIDTTNWATIGTSIGTWADGN
jgi:hypothetical protein